ncbi:MAG TPA: hypothetical protein VL086_05785 [Candidatus Nitrosotalea sp.]|jgi:hypothetical protein|nr:hypothetical protein [Candidatus Nitrosotalea sp.]
MEAAVGFAVVNLPVLDSLDVDQLLIRERGVLVDGLVRIAGWARILRVVSQ